MPGVAIRTVHVVARELGSQGAREAAERLQLLHLHFTQFQLAARAKLENAVRQYAVGQYSIFARVYRNRDGAMYGIIPV